MQAKRPHAGDKVFALPTLGARKLYRACAIGFQTRQLCRRLRCILRIPEIIRSAAACKDINLRFISGGRTVALPLHQIQRAARNRRHRSRCLLPRIRQKAQIIFPDILIRHIPGRLHVTFKTQNRRTDMRVLSVQDRILLKTVLLRICKNFIPRRLVLFQYCGIGRVCILARIGNGTGKQTRSGRGFTVYFLRLQQN